MLTLDLKRGIKRIVLDIPGDNSVANIQAGIRAMWPGDGVPNVQIITTFPTVHVGATVVCQLDGMTRQVYEVDRMVTQ